MTNFFWAVFDIISRGSVVQIQFVTSSQGVWFFSCFGLKIGTSFNNFGLNV